jgi:hypothetical protein
MHQNEVMECSDFLQSIERRLEDQISRGRLVGQSTSPDQLNWTPEPKKWSIAQIYEHMMLAGAGYLPTIKSGIDKARKMESSPVKHSFFGRFIIRGAGPQGNVPAPKQLRPKPGPYTPDIVERWAAQAQAFVDLAKGAHHVDLCSMRVQNPFFPIFKMNLADCFMIIAEHTERHVQQIEMLQSRVRSEMRAGAST